MITFTVNLPATLTLNEGVNDTLSIQASSDDPTVTSYNYDWTLNGAPVLDWKDLNTIAFNNPAPGQYDGVIQATVTALSGATVIESEQSSPMNVVTIPAAVLIAGRTLGEHLRLRLLGNI